MRVGSLFAGVGGFDLGFEQAGHEIVFQCEADPQCRQVLQRHWPDVPCFEDVRELGKGAGLDGSLANVDLLCGGFPCQDLSVAGNRKGLAGERSGLFFEFARIADLVLDGGGWFVAENVPGLLSSNGGRDFAVVLATLAELGFHDLAWRVLDTRHFHLPQRRRRVFILARRARGNRARQVLLEPESGGGNFEALEEAGPRVAATLTAGTHGTGGKPPGRRQEDDMNLIAGALDTQRGGADDNMARANHLVADCLTARGHKGPDSDGSHLVAHTLTTHHLGFREAHNSTFVAHTLTAEGFDASEDGTGRGTPLAVSENQRGELRETPYAPSVTAGGGKHGQGYGAVRDRQLVRRITPVEAERLQGFPEGWSQRDDTDWREYPKPDGPRYRMMGNAVSVPVARWIGERLNLYGGA